MPADATLNTAEMRSAFHAYEHDVRVRNYKLGALLAFIFMPAGISLDWFVYRHYPGHIVQDFMWVRFLCSLLLAIVYGVLQFRPQTRWYRVWGSLVALFPLFSIAWMIYRTQGGASPYYAGLNLMLLGAAILLRWSFAESLVVFLITIAAWLAACLLPGSNKIIPEGIFFNNFYFLFVTGVFNIAGSWFYNEIRFREFLLRYELDKNREELEASNQKLKELDEAKSRFFANISHELRTPLTLLIAPLETLLLRYRASFDDETRNLLLTMQSNGMRLLKLINDLLDLVRLESGVMVVKRDSVPLGEFLGGLASAARQVADDKHIQLETSVTPEVKTVGTDRDKLEKILLNLMFNALKFTPSGGKVALRAAREGEHLVIRVSDTGMGISAKNLPNLFSRFWQADDSSRRKYQGVGIGLALVKELSEIQGGKVEVTSVEGSGTTFTVYLPWHEAEAEAAPAAVGEPAAGGQDANGSYSAPGVVSPSSQEWLGNLYRRAELFPSMTPVQQSLRPVDGARNGQNQPRLLVADDEPDMLRFLKSQLDPHYQVVEAVDGQQAVDKAGQFLPDIILLDMMMPEKDGMQACREIRARVSTQNIPIILLTARADEETKLKALEAGASDFLPKPFSTTELHVRIKNLVESHQAQIKLGKQNQVLESTIEQLKETEMQLVQTEKLASLGRMSAGIIHEINNPLNYATTGLFTLRKKSQLLAPEEKEEYDEVLKDVEEGIKRVKNIVSDLRSFSHPDNESRDQVDVAEVVESSLRFLSNEWKDRVEVHVSIAPDLTIWANKNKLIQVVVNLAQNSMDAMKDKNFGEEKPGLWIEGKAEGNRSLLIVRDNGMGIESKDLDKIFDPFFTTKDVGEGMGLGLSICYRMVQECDGKISVRTEPGKFCEFTLEFPVKG